MTPEQRLISNQLPKVLKLTIISISMYLFQRDVTLQYLCLGKSRMQDLGLLKTSKMEI